MSIRSSWLLVLLKSPIFLLTFSLLHLSITERGVKHWPRFDLWNKITSQHCRSTFSLGLPQLSFHELWKWISLKSDDSEFFGSRDIKKIHWVIRIKLNLLISKGLPTLESWILLGILFTWLYSFFAPILVSAS